MSDAQPSWIGYTLHGRYKIEALLGSGGMASVYRALDPNLRRTVAVKLIHSHLAQQPEFVERFENEAAAVARLRHPNIVPVYDFSNDRGVYYMVMAYLTGGNLKERLKALKETDMRLPLAETIRIMITICEAVASAHQRGIIHRDLKPANVLFDEQGKPHLTDFGIARLAGAEQTVTVVGTPAYMSPEQIKGDPNLDQRCDIYSLGIMLYEMASGVQPFEGSLGTLMFKHMQEPVPDIRLVNSQVPHALVAIIEKALSKSPQQRFQSATEMASALRNVSQQGSRSGSAQSYASIQTVRIAGARGHTAIPPTQRSTLSGKQAEEVSNLTATQPKRPVWIWLVALALVLVAALSIGGVAFSGILNREEPPPTQESSQPTTDGSTTTSGGNEGTGECPQETVLISEENFCIDIQEVTNAAYQSCVAAGSCTEPKPTRTLTRNEYYGNPEFDEYPVIYVNWLQANEYCAFANQRLPTAAEWDAAAQSLTWPTDEQIEAFEDTQLVRSNPDDITPEGVHDLAGNVREFVADSDGTNKIVKGKSFSSLLSTTIPESVGELSTGFRCAVNRP